MRVANAPRSNRIEVDQGRWARIGQGLAPDPSDEVTRRPDLVGRLSACSARSSAFRLAALRLGPSRRRRPGPARRRSKERRPGRRKAALQPNKGRGKERELADEKGP